MEYIRKNSLDIAEDIVCRWYSNTRGMDVHNKGVILSLKVILVHRLVNQGVDAEVANRMAGDAIIRWAEECEGIPVENINVMECLMVHVSNLIR